MQALVPFNEQGFTKYCCCLSERAAAVMLFVRCLDGTSIRQPSEVNRQCMYYIIFPVAALPCTCCCHHACWPCCAFQSFQTGFQIAVGMKGRQAILSGRDPIPANLKPTPQHWESVRIWCCRALQQLPLLQSVCLPSKSALSVCREAQAMSLRTCNQQEVQERAPKVAKTDAITTLRVKRLTENAVVPTRGSSKAAGYDLSRSAEGQKFLMHSPPNISS